MCPADPQHSGVLLHGGFNGIDATWRWDGTGWQQLRPATPPARAGRGLVFDPVTQQPLMFGGWEATTNRSAPPAWHTSSSRVPHAGCRSVHTTTDSEEPHHVDRDAICTLAEPAPLASPGPPRPPFWCAIPGVLPLDATRGIPSLPP